MAEFKYVAKASLDKVVSRQGKSGSGVVYLPKAWVGKKVVVLLEAE